MHPDDIVLIPLRARDGSVRAYAIVDAADADWVNQWRWCLSNKGYVKRRHYADGVVQELRLHRVILELKPNDGLEGDHINRNRLDCRRKNLRVIKVGQGNQNRGSFKGSSSRFRGVSWYRPTKKWRAQIQVNSKKMFLGDYADESEAASVARAARARLLPFSTD